MRSRVRLAAAVVIVALIAAAAGGFAIGRATRPALLRDIHAPTVSVHVSGLVQPARVPALCASHGGCPGAP